MADSLQADVFKLTSQIVSAHISNNSVAPDAPSPLIKAVYRSLATAGQVDVTPTALVPAIFVEKAVFPDFIVCLEDGKRLGAMDRHRPDQRPASSGRPARNGFIRPSRSGEQHQSPPGYGPGQEDGSTTSQIVSREQALVALGFVGPGRI